MRIRRPSVALGDYDCESNGGVPSGVGYGRQPKAGGVYPAQPAVGARAPVAGRGLHAAAIARGRRLHGAADPAPLPPLAPRALAPHAAHSLRTPRPRAPALSVNA